MHHTHHTHVTHHPKREKGKGILKKKKKGAGRVSGAAAIAALQTVTASDPVGAVMLGLTSSSDVRTVQSLQAAAGAPGLSFGGGGNSRSTKFASKLLGRFNVSGISNGFDKHRAMKTDPAAGGGKKVRGQAIFQQRQEQELKADERRLAELESQLLEIQKRKEMRRMRDRGRRKKKMEYLAACKIQRAVRIHFGVRVREAADRVVSFLRMIAARQAVSIGSWAAAIIGRFAKAASVRFRKWKIRKLKLEAEERQARLLAEAMVEAENKARKDATNFVVFDCLRQGMMRAAVKRISAMRAVQQQQGKQKEKGKKRNKAKIAKSVSPPMQRVQPSGGQFFITETDSGAIAGVEHEEEDEEEKEGESVGRSPLGSDASGSPSAIRQSNVVDSRNVPTMKLATASKAAPPITMEMPSMSMSMSMPLLSDVDFAQLLDEVEADDDSEEAEKRRRIQMLHEQRKAEMARERIRRLQMIEQNKRLSLKEQQEKEEAEVQEREAKEMMKRAWFERFELDQLTRAKAVAKVRAERERAHSAEAAREAKELTLMRKQDRAEYRPPSANLSGKRPGVPRLGKPAKTPEEVLAEQLKKKQEDMLAAEKRKTHMEMALQRGKARTELRLAEIAEKEREARFAALRTEKQIKLEKMRVAAEAQASLQRALEARRLALLQQTIVTESEKLLHSLSDNPLVKGKREKLKRKSGKQDGAMEDGLQIKDLGPVQEWNYNVQPAVASPEAQDASHLVATTQDGFQFDEFQLHATQPRLPHNVFSDVWPADINEKQSLAELANFGIGQDSNLEHWGLDSAVDHHHLGDIDDVDFDETRHGAEGGRKLDSALRKHFFADLLDGSADSIELGFQHHQQDEPVEQGSLDALADGVLLSLAPLFVQEEAVVAEADAYAAAIADSEEEPPKTEAESLHIANAAKASKQSIAEFLGRSNVRPVRIPTSLKDTPYFADYKSVKQLQAAEAKVGTVLPAPPNLKGVSSGSVAVGGFVPPKRPQQQLLVAKKAKHQSKKKQGKVAALLEMVAKARKKLAEGKEQQQQTYETEGGASSGKGPASSPSDDEDLKSPLPLFLSAMRKTEPPPPPLQHKKTAKVVSEAQARNERLQMFMRTSAVGVGVSREFEVSRSASRVASSLDKYSRQEEEENDEQEEADADDSYEKLLNEECDMLRKKLEGKISVRDVDLDSSSSVRASFEEDTDLDVNEEQARLVAQWQKEDEEDGGERQD